jgi:hypothetical protein
MTTPHTQPITPIQNVGAPLAGTRNLAALKSVPPLVHTIASGFQQSIVQNKTIAVASNDF